MTDPLVAIGRELGELRRQQETLLAFLLVLLGRITDHTHMTVREVAQITGLSPWQVRHHFKLECRAGVRGGRIAVDQVLDGWMSYSTARAITKRELAEDQGDRRRATVRRRGLA